MNPFIGYYLTYGVESMEFFTNLLRKLRRPKTKPVKENKIMGLDVPITSYGTPGAYQRFLIKNMYGKDKRPVYSKRFEGDLLNGWEEDGEPNKVSLTALHRTKRVPPDDIQ